MRQGVNRKECKFFFVFIYGGGGGGGGNNIEHFTWTPVQFFPHIMCQLFVSGLALTFLIFAWVPWVWMEILQLLIKDTIVENFCCKTFFIIVMIWSGCIESMTNKNVITSICQLLESWIYVLLNVWNVQR